MEELKGGFQSCNKYSKEEMKDTLTHINKFCVFI